MQLKMRRPFTMPARHYWVASIAFGFCFFVTTSCQRSGVKAAGEDEPLARKILSIDEETFLITAEKHEVWQKTLAAAALEKSSNRNVREFARQINEGRNSALHELLALLNEKGITPPPSLVDEVRLDAMNQLHLAGGRAFDEQFVSLMTADLQESVRHFDRASTLPDPDVRAYAARILPTLQNDLLAATKVLSKFQS